MPRKRKSGYKTIEDVCLKEYEPIKLSERITLLCKVSSYAKSSPRFGILFQITTFGGEGVTYKTSKFPRLTESETTNLIESLEKLDAYLQDGLKLMTKAK